jgi:putative transposase
MGRNGVSNYRRNYVPGGTYFFTAVTHQRRPILRAAFARRCLRAAFLEERRKRPFAVVAVVLLPDHLHTVWTLPPGDADYSVRWARIKEEFTRSFLAEGGHEAAVTTSRLRRRERAVWQRRFWEHTCKDEDDLKRCVDYLHWNPVKHGLVMRVRDYPWSSFHRFVRMGEYDLNWGAVNPCPGYDEPEWE